MRIPVARLILAVLLLPVVPSAYASAASSGTDIIPDAAGLSQLEAKAQTADPRERAYRYTELAHVYTRIAGKQIATGDMEQATRSLKQVEHYAGLVHEGLAGDQRKIKNLRNAEMLLEQATYRLREFLHIVAYEDKAIVQETLKQLSKVNDEILATVFAH